MSKKKMSLGVMAAILLAASTALAGILVFTLPATATISEAFDSTETGVSIAAFPGETICDTVDITNLASVSLNGLFEFAETSNVNVVNYTTDMPKTVELVSGANSIGACITVATDSPAGTVEGDVTITRVA